MHDDRIRDAQRESSAEPCPEVADGLPEFLFVDDHGNFTDPEGNPFDLEALTKHPQYKPPEKWTDEEVMAYGEQRFGWNATPLDHAWVQQVTEAMVNAYPDQEEEIRETTAFVVEHNARRTHVPKPIWTAPLDLRARAVEIAGRQHPRTRRECRSVSSSGGGDPPPEPGDDDLVRPPQVVA